MFNNQINITNLIIKFLSLKEYSFNKTKYLIPTDMELFSTSLY